jgi:cell shape-determining protein MreD
MFTAGADLWPDYWFRATLLDAYFGFITFYVWVAYKERTNFARAAWLLAILLLGNFAMSAYVLRQLVMTRPFDWESLLLRSPSTAAS